MTPCEFYLYNFPLKIVRLCLHCLIKTATNVSLHKGATKRENIKSGLLWWDLKKKEVEEEREVRKLSAPAQRWLFSFYLQYCS